jgi:hypothetical protein
MDVDDDDDMQRALAMSMEAARLPLGTAPAADDADGDDSMSKALAMSMDPEPVATADDDDDMAKALAMSMEPKTAPAPSKHDLLEREGFSARLKELFEEAKAKGQEPNAAAASALAQAQNEQKVQLDQRAAAAASSKHDLLSREGFSTRVKELFEAAKAKGQDANAAAATALAQAQKEQLAAADCVFSFSLRAVRTFSQNFQLELFPLDMQSACGCCPRRAPHLQSQNASPR